MIGSLKLYVSDPERTLLDVAREHDLGVLEIMAANPGVDPWVPGHETAVLLPTAHLLPDAPRQGLVINLAELRLYHYRREGEAPTSSAIGIGRVGFHTPLGNTRVVRKQADPTWYPTAKTRADTPGLPSAVAPGPANPLGRFALYLGWPSYLVHGTNKPYGVGRRVSRGCIRLYPERIDRLFDRVSVGTPVHVVDQPIKLGWHAGDLYIEVHPSHGQLDELERTGQFERARQRRIARRILEKAGPSAGRLNWPRIRIAQLQRLGLPVRITTAPGAASEPLLDLPIR